MELFKKNKAIVAALLVNTVIAVMKFIVAAFSGSAALFSEGIHSTADTFNQIVLLIGKRAAGRKPTAKHPFGYSRVNFFASFIVASLLFFVGGAYSLMEAIEKIEHLVGNTGAHELDMTALLIAAGILAVSIVLEAFSLRTALHEVREEQERGQTHGQVRAQEPGQAHDQKQGQENKPMGLVHFYRETRNSSLIVVVTEDLTAIFGLGLAFVGVCATLLTGNPLWDAIGGAAIGVLLIVAAFILGKEVASLIIGEALPPARLAQIETLIAAAPHASGFRNLKTSAIGTDTVLLEVDVYFASDGTVSAADMLDTIEGLKRDIKALWTQEGIYISTCIEPVRQKQA